jgi:hypothetical protein
MRVVVPFTALAPGVAQALQATEWSWTPVDVSGSDDAYWSLLAGLWESGESFCIVEHDVIVHPSTFDELADCPQSWCAFPVPYFVGDYAGMACVKFSANLIAACPEALQRVGHMSNASHPPRHWCTLDAWLQVVLQSTGVTRHLHGPALGHYREVAGLPQPTHGCVERRTA